MARMLDYDFMINAFAAAGVVAIVAGVVGFFLVMRGQTFAGHALSHVGFTGATGAALIGISPLWGLIGFTMLAGIGMGALGERLAGRDLAIGMILSLSLGFGLLFLHFFTAYATQITALLFSPTKGFSARASAPRTIWKRIPNSQRSSRCQFPRSPAGGTMSTRRISRRASISRM